MAGDGEILAGGDEALAEFIMRFRTRGFRSAALLEALEKAPRRLFLPRQHARIAYRDINVPIACGQIASAPTSVIETVRQLSLTPKLRVLEIGTGSGWQTALIAALSRAVASMERYRTLAESAEATLRKLGLRNAIVVHGDGAAGLPMAAPFDRIVVNAAIEGPPPAVLLSQLSPGGFAIMPVEKADGVVLERYDSDGILLGSQPLPDAVRLVLQPGVAHVL